MLFKKNAPETIMAQLDSLYSELKADIKKFLNGIATIADEPCEACQVKAVEEVKPVEVKPVATTTPAKPSWRK